MYTHRQMSQNNEAAHGNKLSNGNTSDHPSYVIAQLQADQIYERNIYEAQLYELETILEEHIICHEEQRRLHHQTTQQMIQLRNENMHLRRDLAEHVRYCQEQLQEVTHNPHTFAVQSGNVIQQGNRLISGWSPREHVDVLQADNFLFPSPAEIEELEEGLREDVVDILRDS